MLFGVFQLNSNMTIEQKGDNSFQLLYPDDMDGEDLKEAIVIVSLTALKTSNQTDFFSWGLLELTRPSIQLQTELFHCLHTV